MVTPNRRAISSNSSNSVDIFDELTISSATRNRSVHRMKVAVIGGGGREHALAWKLADSPSVTALYALPGNPGTEQLAENVTTVPINDFKAVGKFVREQRIEFVVIGPEEPLA